MMFHVLFASADFRTSIDSVLTLAKMAAIISDLPSSQNSFFENPKNPKNHEHHNIPKKIRESHKFGFRLSLTRSVSNPQEWRPDPVLRKPDPDSTLNKKKRT